MTFLRSVPLPRDEQVHSVLLDANGAGDDMLANMVDDAVTQACEGSCKTCAASEPHVEKQEEIVSTCLRGRAISETPSRARSMADLVGGVVAKALGDSVPPRGVQAGRKSKCRSIGQGDWLSRIPGEHKHLTSESSGKSRRALQPARHRPRSAVVRRPVDKETVSNEQSVKPHDVLIKKTRFLESSPELVQADVTVRQPLVTRYGILKHVPSAANIHTGTSCSSSARSLKKRKSIATRDRASIWHGIFQRLMHEGEVHRDQLKRALDLGGVKELVQDWIDEAFERTSTRSTLNFEEFCSFVECYKGRAHKHYLESFNHSDANGSGAIGADQLEELVASFGLAPMKHVLAEIIAEVDEEATGEFSFEDFMQVMRIASDREGFTKAEYFRITRAFHDHDRRFVGHLDTDEVINVLGWLNIPLEKNQVLDILQQVDKEFKQKFNESMVLKFFAKLRELELVKIQEVLLENGMRGGDHTVNYSQLEKIWQALGYIPEQRTLQESAEDIGIHLPGEISLEGIWRILVRYREQEGLPHVLARDLETAFNEFDTKKKRVVSTTDVWKMFPYFGYARQGEVYNLISCLITQVDLERSGTLFLTQFKKLVRKYREWQIKRAESVFHRFNPGRDEKMPSVAFKLALKYLGCVDSCDEPTSSGMDAFVDLNDGIDKLTFIRSVLQYQCSSRDFVKSHVGYGISEVSCLRQQFAEYDTNGNGYVSLNDLHRLCSDAFPQLVTSQKLRPRLMKHMRELDQVGTLALDFHGFLQLMRITQDIRDSERFTKEKQIAEDLGFSTSELNEFRALFVKSDQDLRGSLAFDQFADLMAGMSVPSRKLQALFNRAVPEHPLWGRREAEFPEFLELMRGLLEVTSGSHVQSKQNPSSEFVSSPCPADASPT